jgi:hypothetical protein
VKAADRLDLLKNFSCAPQHVSLELLVETGRPSDRKKIFPRAYIGLRFNSGKVYYHHSNGILQIFNYDNIFFKLSKYYQYFLMTKLLLIK